MPVDFITAKHQADLDLDFILERLSVVTPYGQMAKKSLKPYLSHQTDALTKRYDDVEKAVERFTSQRPLIHDVKGMMKEIKQLSATFDRIDAEEVLSITELYEIKHLTMLLQRIRTVLIGLYWAQLLPDYALMDMSETLNLLDPEHSGVSAFFIYNCYSETLANIRSALEANKVQMKAAVLKNSVILESEGFKVTASGDVRVESGNALQLQNARSNLLLQYKMDIPLYSIYKVKGDEQLTITNEKLIAAEEDEEYEVRLQLTQQLKTHLKALRYNVETLGAIDLLIAIAQFSVAFNCVRPKLCSNSHIAIKGGRHLKVASGLEKNGKMFTPIDICLDAEVTVITGANMGGKTVSLRMIGQVIAMAQLGLFVPCEALEIAPVDFIYVSVGDAQSVDLGLSTFGAEIKSLSEMLKHQHIRGLVLIDELARGTNPREGYAISRALIEALTKGKLICVITTHYDGLTQIEKVSHYQVNGLSNLDDSEVGEALGQMGMPLLHAKMDYHLTKASADSVIPKDAIKISEWMGLPQPLIERAKQILGGSNGE